MLSTMIQNIVSLIVDIVDINKFVLFNLLIVLIILIRKLCRNKISHRVTYAMWIVLPVFLVVSTFVSFPLDVVVNTDMFQVSNVSSERINEHPSRIVSNEANVNRIESSAQGDVLTNNQTTRNEDISSIGNGLSNEEGKNDFVHQVGANSSANESLYSTGNSNFGNNEYGAVSTKAIVEALVCIYLLGVILGAARLVGINVLFACYLTKNRTKNDVTSKRKIPVYKLHDIKSPFLFGKGIYIDDKLTKNSEQYKFALCHEYCHYIHGDNLWMLVRYVLVCIFWFDPLVHLASKMVLSDSELAVDEHVINLMGLDKKARYSKALVDLVINAKSERGSLIGSRFVLSTAMNGKNTSFLKVRVQNIMVQAQRSIAITVCIAILFAGVVGCSLFEKHNVREATFVEADSLWYDMTETIYGDEQYEVLGAATIFMEPKVISPQMRVFTVAAPEVNSEIPVYVRDQLVSYTPEGELVGQVAVEPSEGQYFESFFGADGECYGVLHDSLSNEKFLCRFDFASGEMADMRSLVLGSAYDIANVSQIEWHDGLFYIQFEVVDSNGYFQTGLMTTDADGNVQMEVLLQYEHILWSVGSDGDFVCMGNDASVSEYTFSFFSVDTDGVISVASVQQEVVDRYRGNSFVSGDYIYMKNFDRTITRFDVETNEEELIFDFNCSYADFCDLENFDLHYVDEDNIILVRNGAWLGPDFDNRGREVIHLTRAESNPNAGKQIITVSVVDYLTTVEGNAISGFNRTNEEYFAYIDSSYEVDYFSNSDEGGIDTIDTYEESIEYAIDKLIVDIRAGVGPDIVLNCGSRRELSTSGVLLDINDHFYGYNAVIDHDDYFMSAIDASRIDDALYNIPLDIAISGLFVDPEILNDESRIGFTYDEFREFSDEFGYFDSWLASDDGMSGFDYYYRYGSDAFFDGEGHLALDCAEFESLMELVEATREGFYSNQHIRSRQYDSFYTALIGTSEIKRELSWQLYGNPSPDGRGVSLVSTSSIAITTCTASSEGSLELVKYALSREVQDQNYNFPVNANSYDQLAEYWINYANEYFMELYGIEDSFDEDTAETIKAWIMQIDNVCYEYPSVSIIVDEEMPAYFEGQKTLDEVVAVIMSRTNLLIDERGF